MDRGLKFNQIAAIDLERDVARRAPGRRKILKVVKRSALRKARGVPSFDARRNSLTTNRRCSGGCVSRSPSMSNALKRQRTGAAREETSWHESRSTMIRKKASCGDMIIVP